MSIDEILIPSMNASSISDEETAEMKEEELLKEYGDLNEEQQTEVPESPEPLPEEIEDGEG